MLYRDFATQEYLDAQYNLLALFPEAASLYAEFCARESEKVREEFDHHPNVPFGPTLAERVDLYPAGRGAPVLIYVHGGFWVLRTQRGVRLRRARPRVQRCIDRGHQLRAVPGGDDGRDRTPDPRRRRVDVPQRAQLRRRPRTHPRRRALRGRHLVAMLLATDWPGDYGLPAGIIKGATVISGLFDLAPFPYTFLQPKVQLTWDQVRRNSPIFHVPDAAPPLLVAYGADETDEFKRQSEDFLGVWKGNGLSGNVSCSPARTTSTSSTASSTPGARCSRGCLGRWA